jgi:hypothetical protein
MSEVTNLRPLKPSRKKLQPGDVFAMQLPDGGYVFGRVIAADLQVERAPMPGSNLIYIYRTRSHDKLPQREELTVKQLLLPPIFINRLPWTKGYFETVAHWPLEPDDILPRHCFRQFTGKYLDEFRRELPGPIEPCGEWGLASYRVIDDEVSDALGIPRVPE